MPEESFESAVRAANAYLADEARRTPFFVAVDDAEEYARFTQFFTGQRGIQSIPLHDFCPEEDAEPDIDKLKETLATRGDHPALLLGVGDAVRLFSTRIIDDLRGFTAGGKLVVPCRGAHETLAKLTARDGKFAERQVTFARPGALQPVEVYGKDVPVDAVGGLRNLLAALENGGTEPLRARTDRTLRDVSRVATVFDAWKRTHPSLPFKEEMLSEEEWMELLRDDHLDGEKIDHWRTFLLLKGKPPAKDTYLSFALEGAKNAEQWSDRLVSALLDLKRSDSRFSRFAAERKQLLGKLGGLGWTNARGADYASRAGFIDGSDRWAYMTDITLAERKAIVASLSGLDVIPKGLGDSDPRLADYLRDYVFSGPKAETFTPYFRDYKRCKILNRIEPDFLETVERLAEERPYTALKTRGAALDGLADPGTGLYWLDALGCEYLGYIQARARILGLSFSTTVVRANLPTLTCYNKDFYESWPSKIKTKSKALDEVKHDGDAIDYQNVKTPEHLPVELDAVDQALDWIAEALSGRKARRILLVSDHGASRLAVIREHENRWEMATKGKHSGRCCPKAEIGEKPDCATEEDAPDGKVFWVLANYDRFRGGRKASVEVHGGATLEEVVVPILEFTLGGRPPEVRNETPILKFAAGATPVLKLYSPDRPKNLAVLIDGFKYPATPPDGQDGRYAVPLMGVKRTGRHEGIVLEGDNEIAVVSFEIEGRAAKVRDDNDNFFN